VIRNRKYRTSASPGLTRARRVRVVEAPSDLLVTYYVKVDPFITAS
jgi:hypothetical protein